MTPLIVFALWSCFAGARSRWLPGRMPRSAAAGQCSQLTAPWTGSQPASAAADWSCVYRLKVAPMSEDGPQRPVFPQQPLFRFIRRVYRCCRLGHRCGGVKGLQGRGTAGQHSVNLTPFSLLLLSSLYQSSQGCFCSSHE